MNIDLEKVKEITNKFPERLIYSSCAIYDFKLYHKEKILDIPSLLNINLNLPEIDQHILFTEVYIKDFCFRRLFTKLQNYNLRGIIHLMIRHLSFPIDSYSTTLNNQTWMTREQLVEHIDYVKTIVGDIFKFEVKCVGENDEFFSVSIDTGGLTSIGIKFLMCWIRYSYEFPGSLALLDTYFLKEFVFPEEEPYNLFLLPAKLITEQRSYDIECKHGLYSDQCICTKGKFQDKEILKNLLEKNIYYLCDLFSHQLPLHVFYHKESSLHLKYTPELISEWIDNINERVQVYKEKINLFNGVI